MCSQETLHEGDVDPEQKPWVCGSVTRCFTLCGLVLATDLGVHAVYPTGFILNSFD
jgi:hypothetical protein